MKDFFFNDPATTEIYTLSLHDALPIFLKAFIARRSVLMRAGTGLRIVGSRHSRDALRLREFAVRNRLPHEWIELEEDRKSTRLNSSHANISYAVFCLKKKKRRSTICIV